MVYYIPATYSMKHVFEIEADSIEEAIDLAWEEDLDLLDPSLDTVLESTFDIPEREIKKDEENRVAEDGSIFDMEFDD